MPKFRRSFRLGVIASAFACVAAAISPATAGASPLGIGPTGWLQPVAMSSVQGMTSFRGERPLTPNITPPSEGCTNAVSIKSLANGRYVSAELGYTGGDTGMLRARATSVGPWEQFELCRLDNSGHFAIESVANALYASAELGYTGGDTGMLRARATTVGKWETYTLYYNASTGNYAFQGANSDYVSTELGYTGGDTGMLRARATSIGPWEQYQVQYA